MPPGGLQFDLLNSFRFVRARIKHRCYTCGCDIPKGRMMAFKWTQHSRTALCKWCTQTIAKDTQRQLNRLMITFGE